MTCSHRSRDLKAVTSIGVVDTVYTGIRDSETILQMVGKRSVYTSREVEEIATRPTTVILFNHHFHLKSP